MSPRDRLPWLLIPLAALLVLHPLLAHGCSCGHDLSFHLLSWQEAATQFAGGNLHPRWAVTPAWGAGEPRFVFYPPLSWTIGALLTLAAAAIAAAFHLDPAQTFAATPTLYLFLALTAAGFAMLHLARRFVSPAAATLAATLYLANPYTLFTAFERAAFSELLAAALLPLLLAALLPDPRSPTRPLRPPAVAIPLALLWLTNAPAAILASYATAFLLLLRLIPLLRSPATRPQALSLALRALADTALGLSLAAFYIGPVLLERTWVQTTMAILPGLRPEDNTLFHHTPDAFHDQVLHTASELALLLLTLTVLALFLRKLFEHRARHAPRPLGAGPLHPSSGNIQMPGFPMPPLASPLLRPPDPTRAILAILTAAIALLLTPVSLPLWRHLPELAFLQFPWRLLALLAPVCALALALTLPRLQLHARTLAAAALLLPLTLSALAFHLFHQPCDPEDTPQSRFANFHSNTGEEPTDEYTPATADNDSLKDHNPPFRLLPLTTDDDTPPSESASPGPAPLSLTLDPAAPANLVLNLRDYPTWLVTLNGHPDPDRVHRADGLLTLALPAGPARITLTQHTPSAEYAADALSAVALALFLATSPRRLSS